MKTYTMMILGALLALTLLSACGQGAQNPNAGDSSVKTSAYQKITAEEGKALLDGGTALTLVDVRRADEYETAHIPSAINVPNESIADTQPDALPDLDGTVVVYCRTGVRSKEAADKLVKMGYTDVRDMGGIADWPYATVTGTEPGAYAAEEAEQATGGIMSSFSATDLEATTVDQSIFEGYDLTMVNVWATYCGPCLSEMPDLGELSEQYAEKGVRIVGLVTDVFNSDGTVSDSQLDTAREIVSTTGANYLHIIPSQDLYGLVSQITAVPTTFFVDSTGKQVGSAYLGARSKADWETIIAQTLEEVAS